MKKYGKYEKRPEGVPQKPPKVKNVLLQTYFTSLLSLVLCVSMFLGTTYAWFTSEVSNVGNEIYIGILDVDLRMDGASLSSGETKVFDNTIHWEPGYTALRTLSVVNEGDLAFNYALTFTDGKIDGKTEEELLAIAKWFDIWVYHDTDNTIPTAGSYADITAEKSGWTNVGTLADVLAGKAVFSGSMNKEDVAAAPKETHTYTIALHMNESAENTINETGTNSLMGKSITLNVKLTAYQMVSEQDAFGSVAYDDTTAVSNAEALKLALGEGGNVLLTSDVKMENAADRVTMNGGTLDGNGNTIAYAGDKVNGYSAGVITTSGGTVRNLTIEGGDNGRALYITELASDLFVSDCTLSGAYSFNLNSSAVTEHSLYFTDTTFESWTSYANVMEHAYFTGCTFNAVLRPYGDTTLTNCTFTTEGLDVSALADGETITLINCTYNGQLVEKAVLTANNEAITITESDAIAVDSENQVVLKTNS